MRRYLLLAGLIGWLLATANAQTPLDARRRLLLERTDRYYTLGNQDPQLPAPNLRLGREQWEHERHYLEKALTLFALVQLDQAPRERLQEANRLLRYSLARWPATEPGHVLGQYARAWNHRDRSLAVRLYYLYSPWLENDARREFEKRLRFMLVPPFVRQSENIKMTNNSAYLLAHELLGEMERESYGQVKAWLVDAMQILGRQGGHEWGSTYHAWTLGAVLNLAEFARDEEVKRLATMVVDYTLALQSGFCLDSNFCSPAVRRYLHWTINYLAPQTIIARTLFTGDPQPGWEGWVEWAASNYRPPRAVATLYGGQPATGRDTSLTTGPHEWRYRCYRGRDYAIAAIQAPRPNAFVLPSGGTHDIVGCFVQSTGNPLNQVVPYSHIPWHGPSKKRSRGERYFGYRNVVFVSHGGVTKAVWAGGVVSGVSARLFYAPAFQRFFEGGWAFLTDGTIYVAWAPTVGDPIDDPQSSAFTDPDRVGRWIQSTHVPGDEGEVCVIEVGDSESHGDFERFRREILSRNPRPRWTDGRVVYRTQDGTALEFRTDSAAVNGERFEAETFPHARMPGLEDYTVIGNEGRLVFDFGRIEAKGSSHRLAAEDSFGAVR